MRWRKKGLAILYTQVNDYNIRFEYVVSLAYDARIEK